MPDVSLQENPLVRKCLSAVLRHTAPPAAIDVNGHALFLDSGDSLNLSVNPEHEPCESQALRELVCDGNTVVDIGANIGYFTLLLAKLVGPSGRVFAFEPDPNNVALLRRNIARNGYKNITVEQSAVSDTNESIRLFLCETNSGDHRVYSSGGNRKSVEVSSTRLDDYFFNMDCGIDFIKMDIQGAEWSALQGMSRQLERNASLTLLTEFWPRGLQLAGADPSRFFSHLLNLGFRAYELGIAGVAPIAVEYEQLVKCYSVDNNEYTNLLFRRS